VWTVSRRLEEAGVVRQGSWGMGVCPPPLLLFGVFYRSIPTPGSLRLDQLLKPGRPLAGACSTTASPRSSKSCMATISDAHPAVSELAHALRSGGPATAGTSGHRLRAEPGEAGVVAAGLRGGRLPLLAGAASLVGERRSGGSRGFLSHLLVRLLTGPSRDRSSCIVAGGDTTDRGRCRPFTEAALPNRRILHDFSTVLAS